MVMPADTYPWHKTFNSDGFVIDASMASNANILTLKLGHDRNGMLLIHQIFSDDSGLEILKTPTEAYSK